MNRLAPSPLVEKAAGGSGGGYARLTKAGHNAVAFYRKLHIRMEKIIEEESPYNTGDGEMPYSSSC
jgi:molybdate transport repressor ModE-like protein